MSYPTLSWQAQAACADPSRHGLTAEAWDTSHMIRATSAEVQAALQVCSTCPVQRECLEFAFAIEGTRQVRRWGTWGGTLPRQRNRLARQWSTA